MTEQARQQIAVLKAEFATENARAIELYLLYTDNWKRNAALLVYCIPPQPVPPKPTPPLLKSLVDELVGLIFDTFERLNIQRAGEYVIPKGGAWTPGYSPLDPDYSSAVILTPYVPVPDVDTHGEIPQPLNPLGRSMGKGKRAALPGDKYPAGKVIEDEAGDTWIKVINETIMGNESEYDRQ